MNTAMRAPHRTHARSCGRGGNAAWRAARRGPLQRTSRRRDAFSGELDNDDQHRILLNKKNNVTRVPCAFETNRQTRKASGREFGHSTPTLACLLVTIPPLQTLIFDY